MWKVAVGISCVVCMNSTSKLVNYSEITVLFMLKIVHKTVPQNLYGALLNALFLDLGISFCSIILQDSYEYWVHGEYTTRPLPHKPFH
jgi:hypothetical protein